jgi:hypothetical protein
MTDHPLDVVQGHILLAAGGGTWLLDTGAPSSFGVPNTLEVGGRTFDVPDSYLGMTADFLSEAIAHPITGLLGADVLQGFDVLLDVPARRITLSEEPIQCGGDAVPMRSFMGVPMVEVEILDNRISMFFDTGAPISYLQDPLIEEFPDAGVERDFYPGFGEFETRTRMVEMSIGRAAWSVRCGELPELLGMTLMMGGARGIVGNAIALGRPLALLYRRRQLVFC